MHDIGIFNNKIDQARKYYFIIALICLSIFLYLVYLLIFLIIRPFCKAKKSPQLIDNEEIIEDYRSSEMFSISTTDQFVPSIRYSNPVYSASRTIKKRRC